MQTVAGLQEKKQLFEKSVIALHTLAVTHWYSNTLL